MKFSVVIPVYNVKDYLEKCVQSVLAQRGEYEILLVDDGSTDGSGALCDALAARAPETIRVIHKPNGGLGDARNVGLEHARGEYLVFLDSDDYLDPSMLEELSRTVEETRAEIVTFGFRVDNGGDTSQVCIDPLPEGRVFTLADTPELLLALPNAWTRIYARRLFLDSGIRYPGRVWYEDIRTTTKLFAVARSVVSVHRPYYYYVVRENSITRNKNIARNREIIDAFDDLLGWYREHGLFARYRDELCRLAIDHLFLAASVRVLTADPKHALLGEFYSYMREHFPDFEKNRYAAQLPRAKKLAFALLLRRRYRLLAALFRAKNRAGR
ncbi:MAG TPA: glycosyltransferase family 2 protein [Candidatus Butyricicoccus stercorigallinarum]|nr:glycosyltransferase family 2 protein [Candidatus Butyricicoccus stercorigallinarum]